MRIGEYPEHQGSRRDRREADPAIAALWHAKTEAPPPETTEVRVLKALGFGKPVLARLAKQAARNGTTIEQELLHDGWVDENAYYAALAQMLKLPYLAELDARKIHDAMALDTQLQTPRMVRLQHLRRETTIAIVPQASDVPGLLAAMSAKPAMRAALAVTSPSALRQSVWRAGAARRVRDTVSGLFDQRPRLSARIVLQGRQGFFAGSGLTTGVTALLISPGSMLYGLHIGLSLFYMAALLLRLVALRHCRRPAKKSRPPSSREALPIYTVLVPLHHEAPVVPQLLATLKRLAWPASRLDIKLICETNDIETIAAIRAQKPPAHFELVEVPQMLPQTKPKALTYALPAARGRYLVIYDAEDRPHPNQLQEAHAHFQAAAADVACLQAPLVVTNAGQSWLSALFALEYAALFRGLLPMLAAHRLPLPLGGTSNHFRTDLLRAAGGWDPYNVTEDADLGMRLHRLGYRAEVLKRPTLEDAPTERPVWIKQRTRWFKGWMQTWLVMMRNPVTLRREMGTRGFLVFQLLIGGMLLSSLGHPLILLFPLFTVWTLLDSPTATISLFDQLLFGMDIANILGSYAIFLAVGKGAMTEPEQRRVGRRWLGVPAYWMLVSFAAWRSLLELNANPFLWNKTPHRPHVPAVATTNRGGAGYKK